MEQTSNNIIESYYGHLARSNPEEDHHRVIAAALRPVHHLTGGDPPVVQEPLG